jgi:hypothetical protein
LSEPDVDKLAVSMREFEKVIENVLKTEINVKYIYPWERLFEVEVEFN